VHMPEEPRQKHLQAIRGINEPLYSALTVLKAEPAPVRKELSAWQQTVNFLNLPFSALRAKPTVIEAPTEQLKDETIAAVRRTLELAKRKDYHEEVAHNFRMALKRGADNSELRELCKRVHDELQTQRDY